MNYGFEVQSAKQIVSNSSSGGRLDMACTRANTKIVCREYFMNLGHNAEAQVENKVARNRLWYAI